MFPSSGERREIPTLFGPVIVVGPNRIGVSLPSHENGKKSSF
jgi:hypothetical protein